MSRKRLHRVSFIIVGLVVAGASLPVYAQSVVGRDCSLKRDVNLRGTARGTGAKIRILAGQKFTITRENTKSNRVFLKGASGEGWINTKRVGRVCILSELPKPESQLEPSERAAAPSENSPLEPSATGPESSPVMAKVPPAQAAADADENKGESEPQSSGVPLELISADSAVPNPKEEAGSSLPEPARNPEPRKAETHRIIEPPQWIESADSFRLAVMDVEVLAQDLDPLIGESMSAVMAAELLARSRGRYHVVSRGDMRMMVSQVVEAQQLGCTEPSCLMDLGKLSAAEKMVTARIARIGDDLVFTLELVDLVNGLVIGRQAASWKGDPRGLVELCRPYLARLIEGSGADHYQGQLQVLASEDDALVHLDTQEVGRTPIELYPNIPIGRHRVQVKKPGFLLYDQDVVINHRETTLLQVELIDEDTLTPWYRRWWVWTGAAALVAGAVTTGVLLQNHDTTATFDGANKN